MKKTTSKMAERIAGMMKGLDRMSPVEQMSTYLAIGEKLACVVEDEGAYGDTAVTNVVSLVPQLRSKANAYVIMNLFRWDELRELILKETATPMDNGKHLTLGHWFWLVRYQSGESEAEQDAWLVRELAWLRKESPSAEVLEHVTAILKAEHLRGIKEIRETAQEAISVLEMI